MWCRSVKNLSSTHKALGSIPNSKREKKAKNFFNIFILTTKINVRIILFCSYLVMTIHFLKCLVHFKNS